MMKKLVSILTLVFLSYSSFALAEDETKDIVKKCKRYYLGISYVNEN
jgi:hypothetical protein